MRRAVRAIIIKDNALLVMHRNKFGHVYDALPGGNVEMGETLEQALLREIDEETTVAFTQPHLVCIEHAGQPYGDQYVFLCQYANGEPALRPDSEESHINKLGQNLYQPGWLSLETLGSSSFLSEELKQFILGCLQNGWPKEPVEIG